MNTPEAHGAVQFAGDTDNARLEVMAQHTPLLRSPDTASQVASMSSIPKKQRECIPYPNLPSLATTPVSLIHDSSLQRSQDCLEKIQHVLCEEIHEPTPTALRIQAHTGERGSVPPVNEDTSIFSLIRTCVKHK